MPSLNIESSFGRTFPRFYIRGLGNTDFDLNASQPVSMIYDEVVLENPILKGMPLFDVERVEVLRGPQGTLFGRNTPAGVVKFDTVKPSQEKESYVRASYGTFDTIDVKAAFGGKLTDTISARLSGVIQTRSDWIDNGFTGEDDALGSDETGALRLQFLFEPTENFSALLNLHAWEVDGTARVFRANIIKPGTNDLVDGFDEDKVTLDGLNHSELDSQGASARLSWNLNDDYTLYSITGYESVETYSRGDIDGGTPDGPGVIPFQSETADGIPRHAQWTQEFRIESNTGTPWNWQGGVFYFNEDYDVESFSYDSLNDGAPDGYERVRQTNDSWAVFAAATWQATDALELRAGARYTWDEKELNVLEYWNTGFAPCIGPTLGIIPGPVLCTIDDLLAAEGPGGTLSAAPEDKKFSWDLSATYEINDDVNLYARVATGYRGSSIQAAGAFNRMSVAGPETSTSYEAGVKADLWNNRARLNAGIFYYEVEDQQLTAVGGAANANILLNADRSVGQGFEMDFQAYLTDNLLVTLGSSYNDTEIKDSDLNVAGCVACTVTDEPVINPVTGEPTGSYYIGGNELPQAPKWTHNLTARWGLPMDNGNEFYVYTDWMYRDELNFFLYDSLEFRAKSLVEGGLRVGYSWNYGKYDLALFGRNITDEVQVVGAIDFNNLTGMINEPRTFGAEFRASF